MTMPFQDGLVFDTRCKLGAKTSLEIDYELSLPSSMEGEWSGIFLVRIPQDVKCRDLGYLVTMENLDIFLFSDGFVQYRVHGFDIIDVQTNTTLKTGKWFVFAFTLDKLGAITTFIDGLAFDETKRYKRNGPFTALTAFTNAVTLGDREFEGDIARFALYNRVLSPADIAELSRDYQLPRLVEIRGRRGGSVDSVCFVFSDGRVESYGGKGGDDVEYSLLLESDEHVECIDGCKDARYFAYDMSVRTTKGKTFEIRGTDVVPPYPERWHFDRTSTEHEIFGLDVQHDFNFLGGSHVIGVLERSIITEQNQLRRRSEVESGYLNQLKAIKDEAIPRACSLGLQIPTVSDWHVDAKRDWLRFLELVRSKPKLFLKTYLIDPEPRHFSATAAVMSASWGQCRVALKFMVDHDQVLSELKGRVNTTPDQVVPIITVYSDSEVAGELTDSYRNIGPLRFEGTKVKVQSISGLTTLIQHETESRKPLSGIEIEETDVQQEQSIPGLTTLIQHESLDYKYCLVMLLADTTLHDALAHEKFTPNWATMRWITTDLATALYHLHRTSKRIHADLKPLNIVRVETHWRLIDMDVSCIIGEPFGNKQPSSGYCPPEMARALVAKAGDPDKRLNDLFPHASVAYDLWSLGCVVLEMVNCGRQLFNTDQTGNIDLKDLEVLANWSEEKRNQALVEIFPSTLNAAQAALRDLLEKLLEPSSENRLRHWKSGVAMEDVLRHEFFLPPADQGQALQIQIKIIDDKLNQLLDLMKPIFKMTSTLLENVNLKPTLMILLPLATDGRVMSPKVWFNRSFRLFFVDPVSWTCASSSHGEGFALTFPRTWVVQSLPYIKLMLTTLQVASVVGRLAGFPIPSWARDAREYIDEQCSALKGLETEACKITKSARKLLRHTDARCEEMRKNLRAGTSYWSNGGCLERELKAGIQRSSTELVQLLHNVDPNWMAKTGLVKTTCAFDGSVEWVLPQYIELYRDQGRKCLGSRMQQRQEMSPTEAARTKMAVTDCLC